MKESPPPRPTTKQPTLGGARPTQRTPALGGRPTTTNPALAPVGGPSEALHHSNLGCELYSKGQFSKAADAFSKAGAIIPDQQIFTANLAAALLAQRQAKEALELLRKADSLGPAHPSFSVNYGVALGETGSLEEEKLRYRQTLEQEPGHKEAQLNLSIAQLSSGEVDRGVSTARVVVESFPEWPEAHFTLGYALGMKGLFAEEIGCYRKSLELRPGYQEAAQNLGAALRQTLDFSGAAEQFGNLATSQPRDPQPRVDQAICEWMAGQSEEAVRLVEQALDLRPGYLPALTSAGIFYANLERHDQARATAARAVEMYPKFAEAFVCMGLVLEVQHDYTAAVDAYDKALILNARQPGVVLHRADCLAGQGRHSEAIEAFKRVLDVDHDLPEAHASLAESYLALGKKDEARSHALSGAAVERMDVGAGRRLAKILTDLDAQEPALALLDRVIQMDPTDAGSCNAKGQIHSRRREYDKAVDYFERAFRIDPGYAKASYNLGMIHYTRGHHDLARKVLELAIKAQPDHVKALNLLAKTWLKLNQPTKAIDTWEVALPLRPQSSAILVGLVKAATAVDDTARTEKYYKLVMALKEQKQKLSQTGSLPADDEDEDEKD